MNDDNKKKLYDALSKDYDMGSFDTFVQDIQDDAKRQKLYDAIKEEYELPDFDGFSQQLGIGQSAQAASQSVLPQGAQVQGASVQQPVGGVTVSQPQQPVKPIDPSKYTFSESTLDSLDKMTDVTFQPPKDVPNPEQPTYIWRPEENESQIPTMPWQVFHEKPDKKELNAAWKQSHQEMIDALTHPTDFARTSDAARRFGEMESLRKNDRAKFDAENFGKLYNDTVAPIFNEERKKGAKEADEHTPSIQTGAQTPDALRNQAMQAAVANEKYNDPQRIVGNTISKVSEGDALADYVYNRMGIDTQGGGNDGGGEQPQLSEREKEYLKMMFRQENSEVVDKLVQQMYDTYKADGAPKSALEYVASKAVHENMAASLFDAMIRRAAGSSGLRQQLRQMAVDDFGKTQSWGTRVMGGAAPFAVDMLSGGFAVPGAVGNLAVKGGTKLVAREVEKNMVKRAVASGIDKEVAKRAAASAAERYINTQAPILNIALRSLGGAGNFATYEAQTEMIRQMGEGVFQPVDIMKEAVHGAMLGGAMGVVGGAIGNAARNATAAGKVAAGVGGLGAEIGIFTISGAIEKAKADGVSVKDVDWFEQAGESAGMVLGMKGSGAVLHPKATAKQIGSRFASSKDYDLKFDQHNLDELAQAGYDINSVFKMPGKFGEIVPMQSKEIVRGTEVQGNVMPKADKAIGEQNRVDDEQYRSIMNNGDISSDTKRKVHFLATGQVLTPEPVFNTDLSINTVDGKVSAQVTTFNAAGRPIAIRDFDNEEKAKEYFEQVSAVGKLNTINGLERLSDKLEEQSSKEGVAQTEGEQEGLIQTGDQVGGVESGAGRQSMAEAARARTKAETGMDVEDLLGKKNSELTSEENDALDKYLTNLQEEFATRQNERMAKLNVDGATHRGYEKGAEDTPSEEMHDIQLEAQQAEEQALQTFDTETANALDNDPVGTLVKMAGEAEETGDKTSLNAALDYVNSKAAYGGMIQRIKDDINSRVEQSNEVIDSRTHHDDGQIHPATMKADDRKVYVVGGNVGMTDDGKAVSKENSDESIVVVDAETGKIEMADPRDIASLDEPIDAMMEKQEAGETIRQEYAQQMANKIDGVLPMQAGDTYNVTDGEGAQHTVTVVPEDPEHPLSEAEVMVSLDGGEPQPMPKELLQGMAENTNLARLQERREAKAAATEQQMMQDVEASAAEGAAPESQPAEQESAAVAQEPMPMVGEGDNEQPDFAKVSPERTRAYLYDELGMEPEEADQVVKSNQEEADKALQDVEKKKPTPGANPIKYQKEKAEWQSQMDEAQAKVYYWKAVEEDRQKALEEQAKAMEPEAEVVEEPDVMAEVKPEEVSEVRAEEQPEVEAEEESAEDKWFRAYEEEQESVGTEGGLERSELSDGTLSEYWRGALHALGRRVGRRIVIESADDLRKAFGAAPNGYYDHEEGTIHLNADKLDDNSLTAFVFGHEMTHAVKTENKPKVWEAFIDTVKEAMGDGFQSEFDALRSRYDKFIEKQIASGKKYRKLTDAEIEEEIASNWAGNNVLTDADSVRRIVENAEKAGADPVKLTQRILDWVSQWVDKLRKALGRGEPVEADLAAAEKAKALWEDMYNVAVAKQNERREAEAAADVERMVTDGIPEATAKELEDNGLTIEGGVVMNKEAQQLKHETGYKTPNERTTEDEIAMELSEVGQPKFSFGTKDEWKKSFTKGSSKNLSKERIKEIAQAVDHWYNRVAADDLTHDYISYGRYPGGDLNRDGKGALRQNMEYVFTFDLDTSCPRTLQYLNYCDEVEKRIGRPLSQREAVILIETMRAYGQMIPCTYCYAENKRQALKQYFLNFMDYRRKVLGAPTNEEARKLMYGQDKKGNISKAAQEVFDRWRGDDELNAYRPSMQLLVQQYKQARNIVLTDLDDLGRAGRINADMSDDNIADMLCDMYVIGKGDGASRVDKGRRTSIKDIVNEWRYDTIENRKHKDYEEMTGMMGFNKNALALWDEMAKYGKSASSAKNAVKYYPYTDELQKVSAKDRDYINGMGGLRMHSTNDFRIDYVGDYLQLIADMAKYGWKGHTYTKNPDFVRIFGNTGYRINMSIAAYDIDGKVEPNAQEGHNWDEARELREKFPNAGTMFMTTSHAQLQYALDAPWVDMIIPFHASGLPKEIWYNMRRWEDATNVQNESFYNAGDKKAMLKGIGVEVPKRAKASEIDQLFDQHFHTIKLYKKDGKRLKPHFLPGDTVVDGNKIPGWHIEGETEEEGVKRYFDLCRQYGVRPRFQGIKVMHNGKEVDVTEHPGYIKLIKETSRMDTEQRAIEFNLDQPVEALGGKTPMDFAMDKLREFASNNGYEGYKEDPYGVVNDFMENVIKHERETGEERPLDYISDDARMMWHVTRKGAEAAAMSDAELRGDIPYHPAEEKKQVQFSLDEEEEKERKIQGFEDWSEDDLKETILAEIEGKLSDYGIDDVEIKDMAIHGSRGRGTAREGSDLDVVIEYTGDGWSEDGLFDVLNEDPIVIEGINVDINPITEGKTGTLEEYMKRSDAYDAEVLAKKQARFSLDDEEEKPMFYSNAAKAVEGIKQEKATPEQWKAMIEKAGGLKAGEDKWLGLSDWLKEQSDAKHSPTKQEVLDYIKANQIEVQDVTYGMSAEDRLNVEWSNLVDGFREQGDGKFLAEQKAWDVLSDKYDNFNEAIEKIPVEDGSTYLTYNWDNPDAIPKFEDSYGAPDNAIEGTRLGYTTEGLDNKREIALVVPTIESWGKDDEIHFGDAGGGRAVAWIRFGETTTPGDEQVAATKAVDDYLAEMRDKYGVAEGDETESMSEDEIKHLQELTAAEAESENVPGKKVLVIDEIQSKRHQEGREKGYKWTYDPSLVIPERERYSAEKKGSQWFVKKDGNTVAQLKADSEEEAIAKHLQTGATFETDISEIPDAPFQKNWHELAMKRMLRYAAENGYDKIAWTKGEQQAERYSLAKTIPSITRQDTKKAADKGIKVFAMDINGEPEKIFVNDKGTITNSTLFMDDVTGKPLSDFVGKEIAVKMMAMNDGETIDTSKEKVGGEGMKGFYDQILPRFMNKYGKKWGVQVGEVELPNVEEAGRTMWSIDVTPEMKESVMQGQPMFSLGEDEERPKPRALGVPYQGSKSRIATKIVDRLPRGERFVDLFSGGGSVTHAAMLSGKYGTYHMNDINPAGQDLFMQGVRGELKDYQKPDMTDDDFRNIKGTPEALMLSYNGLGRNLAKDKDGRDKAAEQIRRVQRLEAMKDYADKVETSSGDYRDVELRPGDVVYADIPYEGTDQLAYRQGRFDKEAFVNWAQSQDIPIYVSEYSMPEGWVEVDSFDVPGMKGGKRKEKVFVQSKFAENEPTGYSTEEEREESQVRFSIVDDPEEVERLEKAPKTKEPRYRAMVQIDGKLYPPMSVMVDGKLREPTEIGVWEQSDETPFEITTELQAAMDALDAKAGTGYVDIIPGKLRYIKDGKTPYDPATGKGSKGTMKFRLLKDNGDYVWAAYNPWFHTSTSGMNDQFASAWNRPNLVVVKVDVPEDETGAAYTAPYAKNATGNTPWKSGVVNRQLPKDRQRTVTLSKHAKVTGIVDDDEVAKMIAEQLEGLDIEVPFNVVTPSLRDELVKLGVKIGEPEKGNAGDASRGAYEEWKKGQERPMFSLGNEEAKQPKTVWWNEGNKPEGLNPKDYKTYTSSEAKAFFANYRSKDGKVDFTKWAHPELAYITAAAWDGANIPVEELMQIPEMQEAEKRINSKRGSLNINESEQRKHIEHLLDAEHGSQVYKDGKKVKNDYSGAVRQERKAMIVIGRPAGGKSSVFADRLSHDFGARIVDSDIVKPWLDGYDDGYGAGYVQTASAKVAEQAMFEAAKRGDNMVIPRIGGNSVIGKTVIPLIEMGYDVQLYYNDVSEQTSIMRAASRFVEEGRYLSLHYLTTIKDKISKTFSNFAEKNLGEYYDERDSNERPSIRDARVNGVPVVDGGSIGGGAEPSRSGAGEAVSQVVQGRGLDGRNPAEQGDEAIRREQPIFSYVEWKSNDVAFGEKPIEVWNSNSGKPLSQAIAEHDSNRTAPNGKESNLSAGQWGIVRTPAFKNYFGDWEKDPENASKVVDENGEPLVLHHGTNLTKYNHSRTFWVFKPDSHFGTAGQANERRNVAYEDMDARLTFGLPVPKELTKDYAVFLNIRNPKRVSDVPNDDDIWDGTHSEWWEKQVARAKEEGYDGIVYLNEYEDTEHPADSWIAFYPEQVKSADVETRDNNGKVIPLDERFNPDNNDIRFSLDGDDGDMPDVDAGRESLDEVVTRSIAQLAQQHKDSLEMRVNAMRAIGGNLSKLRQAMAKQREYDRETVNAIIRQARMLMDTFGVDNMTRGEVKKLMGKIKDAAGSENIMDSAKGVLDMMIHHHLKSLGAMLDKQLRTRGTKLNSSGVEVQGRLDADGKRMLDAMKEGMKLSKDGLDDRIGDCLDKMGGDDEVAAKEASAAYEGYLLASQYHDDIKASEEEEMNLKSELKEAAAAVRAGTMTKDAYNQFVEATEKALMENRLERMEKYYGLLGSTTEGLGASVARAKAWREADMARVQEIQHNANSDLQGVPSGEHNKPSWTQKASNWSLVRFFAKPLATFDQMLRLFGKKSVYGEGYLWSRFMGGFTHATDTEWRNLKAAHDRLDEKVSEVMGKKMRWSDLFAMERKMPYVDVEFMDADGKKSFKLSQGNLLYIYMVNKMSDGQMKLRKMGITEEDVDAIKEQLDPRFVELADWLQDEFLVDKRKDYNKVHERLFGASMAAIDNYFPLKINSRSRIKPEDIGEPDKGETKPATVTGSIVKRTKNAIPLDITRADAFDVVLEHLQNMEHWAAFAEFNHDLNALLSYKKFRNKVENMSTLQYGSGDTLWKNFKDVCAIAAGAYRPMASKNSLDSAAVNIAKGVTGAKIAFRVYTALKQLMSYPAYLSEANLVELAKTTNPYGAYKSWNWAMENLPGFSKRWQSRRAGDNRLDETDMDWSFWKNRFIETAGRWGMTPNALVDGLTVAMGSKAIYETKLKQYLKDGYDRETADEKAKLAASVAYNATQQSSEGGFMSAMQQDRTVASVALTVFRNASMSYQRKMTNALRNLKHKLEPGYRTESIEFMKKQMMREGLDEAHAERAAKRAYNRSWYKDIADVAIFGFVMQTAWNLSPYFVYLLMGDDDDEKMAMREDAMMHALAGGVEGLTGGNVMSELYNMGRKGEDISRYNFNLLPIMSDLQTMLRHAKNDDVLAANDFVNLMVQSGVGVNPQTFTDAFAAIMDYTGGDAATSHEFALMMMRLAQVPQGQLDKLYLDELGMNAREASAMRVDELAKRYAEYKVSKAAPLMKWAYSDAAEQAAEGKYIDRFMEARKERLKKGGDKDLLDIIDEYKDGEYKEIKEKKENLKKQYGSDLEKYGQAMAELAKSPEERRRKAYDSLNRKRNEMLKKGMYKEYDQLTRRLAEYLTNDTIK